MLGIRQDRSRAAPNSTLSAGPTTTNSSTSNLSINRLSNNSGIGVSRSATPNTHAYAQHHHSASIAPPAQMFIARAQFHNEAEFPGELSFRKGDVLKVINKVTPNRDGWWTCQLEGKIGLVPGNRLEVLGPLPASDSSAVSSASASTSAHGSTHNSLNFVPGSGAISSASTAVASSSSSTNAAASMQNESDYGMVNENDYAQLPSPPHQPTYGSLVVQGGGDRKMRAAKDGALRRDENEYANPLQADEDDTYAMPKEGIYSNPIEEEARARRAAGGGSSSIYQNLSRADEKRSPGKSLSASSPPTSSCLSRRKNLSAMSSDEAIKTFSEQHQQLQQKIQRVKELIEANRQWKIRDQLELLLPEFCQRFSELQSELTLHIDLSQQIVRIAELCPDDQTLPKELHKRSSELLAILEAINASLAVLQDTCGWEIVLVYKDPHLASSGLSHLVQLIDQNRSLAIESRKLHSVFQANAGILFAAQSGGTTMNGSTSGQNGPTTSSSASTTGQNQQHRFTSLAALKITEQYAGLTGALRELADFLGLSDQDAPGDASATRAVTTASTSTNLIKLVKQVNHATVQCVSTICAFNKCASNPVTPVSPATPLSNTSSKPGQSQHQSAYQMQCQAVLDKLQSLNDCIKANYKTFPSETTHQMIQTSFKDLHQIARQLEQFC